MFWTVILSLWCAIWLVAAYMNIRVTRLVRDLKSIKFDKPKTYPGVSVIIPACNEADTLESAIGSKLASGYPDLEFILIDDRSTDSTGEIIERLAREDDRIRAIKIDKLPEGWLGKPYALKRGTEIAKGEWLLFTDADVHFSPGIIGKAVSFAEDRGLGQLGIIPRLWSKNFSANVLLSVFMRTYGFGGKLWAADNPKIDSFTGVGAFNLVRRSAYDKSEGFDWLKCEVGDDIAVGKLIKRAGGKTMIATAYDDLAVEWYDSVSGIIFGLERVMFTTVGNFSFIKSALFALVYLILELLPFWGIFAFRSPILLGLCSFMIALGFFNAVNMNRWSKGPILPALLFPLGALIYGAMIIRGGWLGWRRGGIYWRGTFYPAKVLKKGRRVSLT